MYRFCILLLSYFLFPFAFVGFTSYRSTSSGNHDIRKSNAIRSGEGECVTTTTRWIVGICRTMAANPLARNTLTQLYYTYVSRLVLQAAHRTFGNLHLGRNIVATIQVLILISHAHKVTTLKRVPHETPRRCNQEECQDQSQAHIYISIRVDKVKKYE